ncbi:DNA polymerase III subunit alpha [bacterium]|nr:DNA polymerase III subunit alpha [bacterium]
MHTEYSLLDGACCIKGKKSGDPSPLFAQVKAHGMDAVAMTDHGNLFGVVDFVQHARQEGVKPIIGCEVYLAEKDHRIKGQPGERQKTYHLTLLCENLTGYRNLLKLASIAYVDGLYYKPRMDKGLLAEFHEGLICLSGCLTGEVSSNLARDRIDLARKGLLDLRDIFGEKHLFVEVMHNGIPDQEKATAGAVELARELGLPLAATNDCHYLRQSDSEMQDVLLCVQTNRKITDPDRMHMSVPAFYIKSPEEMVAELGHLPGAIENTLEIAERCNVELDLSGRTFHMPHYEIPSGEATDHAGYLRRLVEDGARQRYGDPLPATVQERIDYELSVIGNMKYESYFLIVWDFVAFARKQGIAVGPGRGSAAGSIVAYCLGITNIDPLKYDLLFERFLNPDRVSMPDIDIDFDDRRRDEVIRYVSDKYGQNSVAQIATMGRIKAKNAIRDVGRVLDIPLSEVNRVAKLIPEGPKVYLSECLEEIPELSAIAGSDARYRFWFQQAQNVEGMIRQVGVHAAGVVIAPGDLREYAPLMDTKKEGIAAQYTMEGLEALGLLKMDFLGLATLSVIERALELIRRRGVELELDSGNFDDPKTYDLISSGRTDGVFQVESTGMKNLLAKLQPRVFEELIALMALYRPGPLGSGMVETFVNCKHGRETIVYDHPSLEPILRETYGVILYQEQVMRIAVEMAGFTLGQADLMRRAMGKKKEDVLAAQKEAFVSGAVARGYSREVAEKVFDKILFFAGYGFNKSHSAAYAVLTYQTAFLKANYPREFMASLLSNEMGHTEKMVQYIRDCRELGIAILAPDINRSETDFSVEEGGIRYGLGGIKGLGAAATQCIIREREARGPFRSLFDFCDRIEAHVINSKTVESLVRCGAFDGFGLSRGQLLAMYPKAMEQAAAHHRDRAIGQLDLFGMAQIQVPDAIEVPDAPDLPESERLADERQLLGIYVSGHPLDRYQQELAELGTTNLGEIEKGNMRNLRLAGVVSEVKKRVLREGEILLTFMLEDAYAALECRVFGDAARNLEGVLTDGAVVVVEGNAERRDERLSLRAYQVLSLPDAHRHFIAAVHLPVTTDQLAERRLAALRTAFARMRGGADLFFHVTTSKGESLVIKAGDDFKILPSSGNLSQLEEILEVPRKSFAFDYAANRPKPSSTNSYRPGNGGARPAGRA